MRTARRPPYVVVSTRIPVGGYLRGLNAVLPRDVAVVDVADVPEAFDARLAARGKHYRYLIWNHLTRSPLHERRTWHLRAPLDVARMRAAAALLVGEHDFRGFRASDCDRVNTVRVIRRFHMAKQGAMLDLDVEATAFLKNMVRILAGTLVDVGRGRRDVADVRRALETGDRTAGGVTAPARGLTLVRVIY